MEHILRCNSLKCRKELNDHAVVTTCSHIFCIDCSNSLQLSSQTQGRRPICPACEAQLPNPDDVVVTNLNPTEDYKTSVLSGLNPNVIMECAGRALSFWAYQTTQEIVYQEYLAKSLTNKYSSLNSQLDKIVHDANSEISNLRAKVSNMQVDQDTIRRKNEDLTQALREKNRKHLQTQELYDKLKRRAMLGQVQNAALDAVDHTIEASVATDRFEDRVGNRLQRPQVPLFSNHQNNSIQQQNLPTSGINSGHPIGSQSNTGGNWAGFDGQPGSQNIPMQTPSTHRHRLAPGNIPLSRASSSLQTNFAPTPVMQQQQRVSPRPPLLQLSHNTTGPSGFAGYGMSAGLKVSNSAGSVVNGMMKPVIRSRVAQRPSPTNGYPQQPTPNFGPGSSAQIFSTGEKYY